MLGPAGAFVIRDCSIQRGIQGLGQVRLHCITERSGRGLDAFLSCLEGPFNSSFTGCFVTGVYSANSMQEGTNDM